MHTLTEFWTSRCIIGEMVEEKNGEVKMTPPLVNFVNGKGLVVLGLSRDRSQSYIKQG